MSPRTEMPQPFQATQTLLYESIFSPITSTESSPHSTKVGH